MSDRYEDVPAELAYRNLVEGEDAFERAVERQEEATALMYEQQPDADDEIDAAVLAVELARDAESDATTTTSSEGGWMTKQYDAYIESLEVSK